MRKFCLYTMLVACLALLAPASFAQLGGMGGSDGDLFGRPRACRRGAGADPEMDLATRDQRHRGGSRHQRADLPIPDIGDHRAELDLGGGLGERAQHGETLEHRRAAERLTREMIEHEHRPELTALSSQCCRFQRRPVGVGRTELNVDHGHCANRRPGAAGRARSDQRSGLGEWFTTTNAGVPFASG